MQPISTYRLPIVIITGYFLASPTEIVKRTCKVGSSDCDEVPEQPQLDKEETFHYFADCCEVGKDKIIAAKSFFITDICYPNALTDAEYVAKSGTQCPVCKGEDIAADNVQLDGDEASQDVGCHRCQFSWTDHFVLSGYYR